MPWDDGIEGNALEIARTDDSPLRIMAGPGTGKSFTMKRRVARILEEEDVEPEEILALTFTRTAARDLMDELHQLEIDGCENIHAGTLHSFCFSLLGRNRVLEYLNRHPQPLITFTSSGVLRFQAAPMLSDLQYEGEFGGLRDITERIRAYEAAWARLQRDTPGWVQDEIDRAFENALIEWLRFHKGMLIGELVPYALRYLRDNPQAPERDQYEYVIVDEYQDLNRAEQVLIDLISENSNRSIVGDVDQSIYSFKHAHPEGIVEYANTHHGTRDANLNQCRRCPTSVVQIADSLIRENHPGLSESRLTPHEDNPEGEIHIIQSRTYEQEAEVLSQYINSLIESGEHNPEDILVLTPRKFIGYTIRDRLNDRGIPVHSYYHEEAFEEDQAQEAFSKLALLVDREDRLALRYLLGYESATWLRRQYRQVREYCNQENVSPYQCLLQLESGEIDLNWTNRITPRFTAIREELDQLENQNTERILNELFPEAEEWATQIRELAYEIYEDEITLQKLIEDLTTRITQPVMPEEGEYVRIMSLHKSKGLSSPVVIIAGCVEGVIPLVDRDLEGEEWQRALEEQRRLFYVAVTRTKEKLVLSSFSTIDPALAYRNRITTRAQGITVTSRFIEELGPTAPDRERSGNWIEQLEFNNP